MSNALLLSIKPEWVSKILNGEKTIEIRRKFPKDYVGWVYIYCTKEKPYLWKGVAKPMHDTNIKNPFNWVWKLEDRDSYLAGGFNGKIIGRFWCDKVEDIKFNGYFHQMNDDEYTTNTMNGEEIIKASCLDLGDLIYYLGGTLGNSVGYAIHISKLEVFDTPRDLWEFKTPKKHKQYITDLKQARKNDNKLWNQYDYEFNFPDGMCANEEELTRAIEYVCYGIQRAPQNYCYIEI